MKAQRVASKESAMDIKTKGLLKVFREAAQDMNQEDLDKFRAEIARRRAQGFEERNL